jgi:hypothetical protein
VFAEIIEQLLQARQQRAFVSRFQNQGRPFNQRFQGNQSAGQNFIEEDVIFVASRHHFADGCVVKLKA